MKGQLLAFTQLGLKIIQEAKIINGTRLIVIPLATFGQLEIMVEETTALLEKDLSPDLDPLD